MDDLRVARASMPAVEQQEPLAKGVIVPVAAENADNLHVLAREMVSILRALRGEARVSPSVPADADFVMLLVDADAGLDSLELPDLKDRVGAATSFAQRKAEGRMANHLARKRLRSVGAALGARELVFGPDDMGHMGLESDAVRERLQELLQTLVLDAERLRLRREGWEEPDEE